MDTDGQQDRLRRPKPRVEAPSNGPPPLSPVDIIIGLHHGSSTAIEATPERLQASKQYRVPSLPERIEELQRKNSSLNYEVACYRRKEQFRKEFEDRVKRGKGILEYALYRLGMSQQQLNQERSQMTQGSGANVGGGGLPE